MKDSEIVKLFFNRSESAIEACEKKYGGYCRAVAMNILDVKEDAEEAVIDAYLSAWNTIPPKRPENLAAYLGLLCRSRALDIYKAKNREKRGGGRYEVALDELSNVLSSDDGECANTVALTDALNKFLAKLPDKTRKIFMRRYFWSCSVADISYDFSMSEGAVKMLLSRTREKLKIFLEKEGFCP